MRWQWNRVWLVLLVVLAIGVGCAQKNAQMKKMQRADAYYKMGIFYLENENYKEAISQFRKALDVDPTDPSFHFSLGTAYSLDGQDGPAIDSLKRALHFDPKNSEAHNNLGYIYAKGGRWPEAIAEFKAALANPDYRRSYSAHLNLAQAYIQLGNIDSAKEEYRRALEVKPDSEVAHAGLGRAYQLSGQTEKAIEEWEKALKINERQTGLYLDLAKAYSNKGDKEKAIAALKKLIESDPRSPLAEEAKKQLQDLEK